MRIDWSTAQIVNIYDTLKLHVQLVDMQGLTDYEAVNDEARKWGASLGDERREIDLWHGPVLHGPVCNIGVSPINQADIEDEQRMLEAFIERINRRLEPIHAKDAEARANTERLDKLAAQLTDKLQRPPSG
jgi:hypothetical protein